MHYRINKMFCINKYARKTKHYTTFAEYIKYTMIDADCIFRHLCEYHTGVTVLTIGTSISSMYALNLSALCYVGLIGHHKLQSLRALYDKIIYHVDTTKTYSLMPLNFTKSSTHSLNKLNSHHNNSHHQ